jgi:putative SOS response-associated peptidase YedK
VTDANALVRRVHDRMPVILAREDDATWLDPDNRDTDGLLAVLRSTDPKSRTSHPMSRQVSNPRNDSPELLEAVAALPADAPGIEW